MKKLFFTLIVCLSVNVAYAEDWLSSLFKAFNNNAQEQFGADVQQDDRRVNFSTNNSKILSQHWKDYQNGLASAVALDLAHKFA